MHYFGGLLFLTFVYWILKAGTGIAELIALEISKQVFTFLPIQNLLTFILSFL